MIKNPGGYPGYARELAGDLLGISVAGRQPGMMVIDRP